MTYREAVDSISQDHALNQSLVNKTIYHVADWKELLRSASPVPLDEKAVGAWLNQLFGIDATD